MWQIIQSYTCHAQLGVFRAGLHWPFRIHCTMCRGFPQIAPLIHTLLDHLLVPSEAGSEVQEPEPHYMAFINQVYELIFNTSDDDFCPCPTQSIIGSAVTVTEKVARRREPDRVGRAMGRVDLHLPIGSTIKSTFDTVEVANKPSN